MKQLAIKGHATRGNEVIKILEMMGGNNLHDYSADCDSLCFYIEKGTNIIYYDWVNSYCEDEDALVFTLEEFLEKFPYKVGDKVIYEDKVMEVTKLVWEEQTNTVAYKLDDKLYCNVIKELQPYKEETMEVSEEFYNKYCKKCGSQRCTAEGKWLEGCKHYKEETIDKANQSVFDANAQCCDIMNHLIKEETMEETIKIDIPKGYEFAGVDDNNQQVVFEKIDCQYPNTYEKCCEITNSKIDRHYFYTKKDKEDYPEDVKIMDSLDNLRRLLICRNAYWKIAGDWKPDWKNGLNKYCIVIYGNRIIRECYVSAKFTLAFPTAEIRDAFYENFKGLIEQCKELL